MERKRGGLRPLTSSSNRCGDDDVTVTSAQDMGKNYFDRSQSLARVSSASTETDYIPATVPFDWETAPGRSAAAEREIIEAPSLPLPPGRRPKDGFFLPISRSVQRPNLLNEEGAIDSSHRERRPFNLKFPGSSKKTLFKSRKQRKIHKDADCVEDTGSFFNPLSAHRFGSRITRRVLVESQKNPSCFGQCLPVGRKASSSHIDHHRGRGLDAVEDSDGDEHYATPNSSAASGSPLSSPRHGHEKTRDSSITGAGKQLQVPSSRFNMASMLIALFPSESDESDEYDQVEAVDGGHKITEDDGGEVRISEHLSTPRNPVTNSCRSGKLQQVRPGSDDFTNKSVERHTFADCEGKVADAHSVSEPPDRELRLSPTRKSSQSSFSWKSSDQIREKLDPLAAFLAANVQAPEEFAKKRSEKIDGEEDTKRRRSCSSLVQSLPSTRSECSSSSNHSRRSTGQNVVLLDSAASKMVLPTPRSSCGSSDVPFINSCSLDNPKAEVERGRSPSVCATPTAKPSSLRRDSFEERLEPNQPPPRPPTSSLPQSPLQNQSRLHIAIPKAFRTENMKVPSNSPLWLEELKSSSLWPNRAQEMFTQGDAGNRDSGDESGEDIEHSSTDSFEYRTPRAGSSTPSLSSPVLRSLNTSPKPATWVVSEEVLRSSSMFQRKLQQQQSHESPRSSFMLDEETTEVPSPSIAFEQISVTATRLPTGALDECHVNSPDYGSKGEDLALLPVTTLSETSKSGSEEMSKEVQEESKAGVGSSGKSFPIYLRRRGSAIITGKAISSDNGSGEGSDNSSTDSFEHATPRAVSPIQSRNSPVLCKFNISLEPETWVVSEEVFKEVLNSSSSLQCKLQRQLQIMGLQTKSLHGPNQFENRSTDAFEHGTPRAVSLTPSLNSPIFSKFNISLEPESWLVYEEVYERSLSRPPQATTPQHGLANQVPARSQPCVRNLYRANSQPFANRVIK